jgi:hypothetical protein
MKKSIKIISTVMALTDHCALFTASWIKGGCGPMPVYTEAGRTEFSIFSGSGLLLSEADD